MPLVSGTRVGCYEVVASLGAGGMGEVYRARDTRLKREIALKVLPEAFAADPARMLRFEREAEVLASLNHPNIAQIYGVEEWALVMELVEGESPKGPMPFEEAWKIAMQIADALEYAHEKGVIHRDLKPANVKVTPDGVVKLLDFGLAKAFSPERDASGSTSVENSPTLTIGATEVGVILGTAAYMAPEQAKGKRVDKRADIWSWGVMLYELITGDRLFKADDAADTLAQVLTKEPDLAKVPPKLRRLMRQCLEKDPKKRLRDIGDCAALLDATAAADAPPRSKLPWALAAVLSVTVLALLGWTFLRSAPLPPVTRFQIFAPPGSTLPLGTPAPSPDGRMIAYVVRAADGIDRIHVRPMDSTDSRALPGTEGAVHPFWSPDERSLAFVADGELKRIDLASGAARGLAATGGPWHGTWSSGGIILYAFRTLMQIPAEGGPSAPGLQMDAKRGETGSNFPFFLSDGRRFLLRVTHADGSGNIELASLGKSADRKIVLPDVASAPILAAAPNGAKYLLYLRDSSLMAQEFDENSGAVRGTPFLVVDGIGRVAYPPIRPSVGVSPSGILAYQIGPASQTFELNWYDRAGKLLSRVAAAAGGEPRISPDGRFVAVSRMTPTGSDLWLVDLSRGSSSRFTFASDGKAYGNPIWSPDGKRLAYSVEGGGVYVKNADGTGAEQELLKSREWPLSWSPDGRQILLFDPRGLSLLTIGQGAPVPAGSFRNIAPSAEISPDGKYFALQSAESGRNEVYVTAMPPGTGRWQVSTDGGKQPRWRKDGKELFFLSLDSRMMAADIRSAGGFAASIPHALFQSGALGLNSFDVSADGQRFLIMSAESERKDAPITVVLNWWAGLKSAGRGK